VLVNKKEEQVILEDRVKCIDVITRTVLFFQEYEQKLFNDQEGNKGLYLSALKLLSDINFVTSLSNVDSFRDMVKIGLGLQAKLLFLLIGFTNRELQG
jgi:hypothetical protein